MWRATELLPNPNPTTFARHFGPSAVGRLLLVDLGTGPEMAHGLRALRQKCDVTVLVVLVADHELAAMRDPKSHAIRPVIRIVGERASGSHGGGTSR